MNNDMENKLKEANTRIEELESKLIDLSFDQRFMSCYNVELVEFIRELYASLASPDLKKISKEAILKNLKNSIKEFAKNNNMSL